MSRSIDCSIHNVMTTFPKGESYRMLQHSLQKFQETKAASIAKMLSSNVDILEDFQGSYAERQHIEQMLELRYSILIADLNEQEKALIEMVESVTTFVRPVPLIHTQLFDPFFANQTYNLLFNNPHTTIEEVDMVRRSYLGILAQTEERFVQRISTFLEEKNKIVAHMLIELEKFDRQVTSFDDETRERRNALQKMYQNQIKAIMPTNNLCEIKDFIKKLERFQKSLILFRKS